MKSLTIFLLALLSSAVTITPVIAAEPTRQLLQRQLESFQHQCAGLGR